MLKEIQVQELITYENPPDGGKIPIILMTDVPLGARIVFN